MGEIRLGVDLGGTKIEIIALDARGTELLRERVATPREDYRATVEAIAALVEGAETRLGARGTLGIGTPGARSRIDGRMKNCNSTWLNGRPLFEDLQARLKRPIRMANDANCFALSEASDGAGAGAAVVFGVIVGTGTGAGVVVHGRVLDGPNAIAGEWGHNPLPWPDTEEYPGPACYCGQRGCVETWLSGPGLARDFRDTGQTPAAHGECHGAFQDTRESADAAAIAAAAQAGDALADAALRRYESRMARSLAQVINILDPEIIVLGGGMSRVRRLYENVPKLWQTWVFSDAVHTRLLPPVHGDSSGVRGAAWLWGAAPPG